jgi:tRNA(Ile)-lysidine synthase
MTLGPINSRFFAALSELMEHDTDGSIGIAVSGGPDSLALLLLAHANFRGRICAATVDHQLRLESAEEARFVAKICAERDIPHATLHPAQPISGNIQSAARAVRYGLLKDWAARHQCRWIATAHHAEDQLETLLMRMARGSGVAGMAGIRSVNGNIIRPVLGFSKAELITICVEAGITPVEDPSNTDREFDRVRMREWLALGHPVGVEGPTRTAHALAEAAEALDWMLVELETARCVEFESRLEIDPSNLPRELQRRLLFSALRRLDPELTPRGPALDAALSALTSGRKVTLGNILCVGGQIWQISAAPPRRN